MFTYSTSFNSHQIYRVLLSFPLHSLGHEDTENLSNLPKVHIILPLKLVFSMICCVSQKNHLFCLNWCKLDFCHL